MANYARDWFSGMAATKLRVNLARLTHSNRNLAVATFSFSFSSSSLPIAEVVVATTVHKPRRSDQRLGTPLPTSRLEESASSC